MMFFDHAQAEPASLEIVVKIMKMGFGRPEAGRSPRRQGMPGGPEVVGSAPILG